MALNKTPSAPPFSPSSSIGGAKSRLSPNQIAAVQRTKSLQALEELKIRIAERSARNMDVTIRVVRQWMKET